jgi:signal transduction histidine kinase/CheY-like chemotaxis protein
LLVVLEVIHGPYLLDLGILVPIAGVGYALTARFVEAALGLESMVAVRTEELSKTQAALLRAEKLGALGQLAAGVAHEVNNPAAALAGNLRYLREAVAAGGKLPGDGLTCLDESLTSVDRIAGVVRQLLDAGRLATASKAEAAPVSLAKAARDAVRTARARCGDRVAISLDVAEDLWGKGQEHPLVQVLTNLVVNAAQAIAPERTDGQVTVRGQRAGGQVLLVVEDNGAGMSDETQRRLFEPFFTTKAFGQGSGLGLAVSRGLMMALGGDLRFSSRLGGGTRATAELCAAEPSPSAAPPAVAAAPAKPSRGLLIIDDDDEVRDALQRCLGLRYQVSAANGVTAALALLEQGDPWDLILCDLMMPDGGGARVYETLKARSPADAARLVFVTGGATTQEARSYLATNPQPVLQKPVELEVLDKLVESFAVARKAPAP